MLHSKIRALNLSACEVTDDGLAVIADKCKSLSKLDLNAENEPRTDITANGMAKLVLLVCNSMEASEPAKRVGNAQDQRLALTNFSLYGVFNSLFRATRLHIISALLAR